MKRTKDQEFKAQLLEIVFILSIVSFSYLIVTNFYQEEINNPLTTRDAIIQKEIQMYNAE